MKQSKGSAVSSDNVACLGRAGTGPDTPVVRFEEFDTGGFRGFLNRHINPLGPSGRMMDQLEWKCDGCSK